MGALAFNASGNLFAGTFDKILKFADDGTSSVFASSVIAGSIAFEPGTEKLRNISARGLVGTGDDVLIGGFIVGGSALANNAVVVRAIGPSLAQAGVTNPLADPTLELRDGSGAIVASNDDWQDSQEEQITAACPVLAILTSRPSTPHCRLPTLPPSCAAPAIRQAPPWSKFTALDRSTVRPGCGPPGVPPG